jgi:hypothetical protein
MMGINVRCDSGMDYAGLIVDGAKTLETRRTNSLRPWIGQRVGIVRTGRGPAHLVGYAVIGEPIVMDHAAFRQAEDRHLVPSGSAFDAQAGETKYCYPLHNAERLNTPEPVTSRGIIARKLESTDDRD